MFSEYKIKGGSIFHKCYACGAKDMVDMSHKVGGRLHGWVGRCVIGSVGPSGSLIGQFFLVPDVPFHFLQTPCVPLIE